jgi:poly-gamma-glutamate synthesis protein (capsule biosynthesis protein)
VGAASAALVRQLAPGPAVADVSRKAVAVQHALSVTTTLPDWRAIGAPVVVRGYSGANMRLTLRANGKPVAVSVSATDGGYALRFAMARAGRYRLAVQSVERTEPVGMLTVRPLLIDAVGDITFGEQVGTAIGQYGGAYPWTYVARTLRAADITIGNLETSVSRRGTPAADKQYRFRGDPNAVKPLATVAGFDVLTLANNHTVDYGRDALLDTVDSVRAAGIQPIGAGSDDRRARRPAIVEAGGLRVAFLGYSDVNPLGFPAGAGTPGTARADAAAIAADVRSALRRSDIAVCYFHWGTELHAAPDARQQTFADDCLRAGAKVVLGAHPHVLGPVTRPSPSTLVAWSLGNFVFPSSGITAATAILRVQLDGRGVHGYQLLPVRIDGFRPRLVTP